MDKETKNALNRADSWASKYVRAKYSHNGTNVDCYTCGRTFLITEMDNGHCFTRRCYPLRFEIDNMKPQCTYCNQFLKGNIPIYMQRLKKDIGQDRLNEMEEIYNNWLWHTSKRPKAIEFREIAKKYRLMYNEIK